MTNGAGTQTWDATHSRYASCVITACDTGFYGNGDECSGGSCVAVTGAKVSGAGDVSSETCAGNEVPNDNKSACVACDTSAGYNPNSGNTACVCDGSAGYNPDSAEEVVPVPPA